MVVTWSSNPLINAKAYFYSKLSSASPEDFNQRKLRPLSLGETLPSNTASDTLLVESAGVLSNGNPPPSVTIQSAPTPTPTPISDMSPECSVSCPQKRQTSMLTVFPEASRIRYIIWAYFGGFAIWSMVLGIVASTTHKFYREEIDPEADSAYKAWEYSAILYVPYLGAGKFTQRGDWAGYIVQILTQSSIVFGIHCVEIIVNMSRDESSWRKVASVGANMGDSPAKSFMTSWQCVILTLFKSIVQWVFDQAFSADFEVSMALYPLIAMTGLFLRLALFTECLVRRKPHGPQPVTYGDIQRLSKFIDDWDHKRLFWGDKGEVKDGIRRAGTAGSRLCELSPDAKYIGLT
ncbi:hypothetical protein N7488_005794 [Penicillium malachiteum]|nr:hypothetical protein N7488_005794 [Penicillium malachiteum]